MEKLQGMSLFYDETKQNKESIIDEATIAKIQRVTVITTDNSLRRRRESLYEGIICIRAVAGLPIVQIQFKQGPELKYATFRQDKSTIKLSLIDLSKDTPVRPKAIH